MGFSSRRKVPQHGPGGTFSENRLLTALGYDLLAGWHAARATIAGG